MKSDKEMICLKRKAFISFIVGMSLTCMTSFAAFETDINAVSVSKTSDSEYSFTISGTENSGGAMLVIYGDKKGSIGETFSINPEGAFKDYYVYYMRYFPKDNDYMTIDCKADIPSVALSGNVYASLVSYDGSITHLSDIKLPGLKTAEKIKILTPDGTAASGTFKVKAGNAYRFNAEVTDHYGNIIETSDLKYSIDGNTSKNIVLNGNAIVIDNRDDVYGKKFKLTVSVGELSSSIDIEVERESGNNGSGSGSSRSSSTGTSLPSISVSQDVLQPSNGTGEQIFKDLPLDHWAYDSIIRLQSMGIINGSDGNVYPSLLITREEISALLSRALKLDKENVNTEQIASDKTVSLWAVSDVAAAVSAGIIKGDDNGIINGTSCATREEAFAILARAFDISESDGLISFEDADLVSDWAKGYIASMSERGILKGTDGKINPKSNITRAEFFASLDRMIK